MRRKLVLAMILAIVLIGMLGVAFKVERVEAIGTIYIRTDGSVDPPTAPVSTVDNITYSLTDNITSSENGIVVERDNIVVDGAGYTLQGTGAEYSRGIALCARPLTKLYNVTIKGFQIKSFYYCITLADSSNCSIYGNNIEGSTSGRGINIGDFSNYIDVYGNNITNNYEGIGIIDASSNTVSGNTIAANVLGIRLTRCSNNKFYHNNFIDNQNHLIVPTGIADTWDDGYPSGGNYWSDYTDIDSYSGPYQNETGSDGIWDTPYVINADNTDNYPLRSRMPTANFIYSPSEPRAIVEQVVFNASISTLGWNGTHDMPIVNYTWDFGDGVTTNETGPIITHVYTTPGNYSVTLTVTDKDGLKDATTKPIEIGKAPAFVSISTSSASTFVGFRVNINGTLRDTYGNGLRNETVVLYYTFSGVGTWTSITSDTTDNLGHYHAVWIPSATGYFVIKAEWAGNTTYLGAHNTTTLSSLVYENQYVFSVESNSTISALAFNTTNWTLSFTATGPNGTNGYTKVTIAKSLIANITNIRVYLDGNQLEYNITSTDNSWLLAFTYTHSTHKIAVDLDINIIPEFPSFLILPLFMIATLLAVIIYKRSTHKPLSSTRLEQSAKSSICATNYICARLNNIKPLSRAASSFQRLGECVYNGQKNAELLNQILKQTLTLFFS